MNICYKFDGTVASRVRDVSCEKRVQVLGFHLCVLYLTLWSFSPLTGSRDTVCFPWPALVFSISQVVSLPLHPSSLSSLRSEQSAFHHVRLQS